MIETSPIETSPLKFFSEEERITHELLLLILKYQEEKNFDKKKEYNEELEKQLLKNELNKELKNFLISKFYISEEYFNPLNTDKIIASFLLKKEPEIENFIIIEEPEKEEEKEKTPTLIIKTTDILVLGSETKDTKQTLEGKERKKIQENKSTNRIEILKELFKNQNESFLQIEGEGVYKMFIDPTLDKMILVCDEPRNATFVFDQNLIKEFSNLIKPLDLEGLKSYYEKNKNFFKFFYSKTKKDLEALEAMGLMSSIVWSGEEKWKNDILNILNKQTDEKFEKISIDEISKTIEMEKIKIEKFNKNIKEYLLNPSNITDSELVVFDEKQIFKKIRLKEKDLNFKNPFFRFETFTKILQEARKERKTIFFSDQAKNFFKDLPIIYFKIFTVQRLYEIFKNQQEIDYTLEAFYQHIPKDKRKNLTIFSPRVKRYYSSLSDEKLKTLDLKEITEQELRDIAINALKKG